MTTNIPSVQQSKVEHCVLVDIELSSTTTYYLSNNYQSISYNGNDYTQLGYFLQMGELQDDIKPTNNQIQISLAGIPSNVVPDFLNLALNSNIKGSKIRIYRAFFNNGQFVAAYQRFNGYVSNYALSENWDDETRLTSQTVSLQCSNILAVIERQYSGRRTNEKDQKLWYPTDTCFDRIKTLADSSFDFGKKK